MREIERVKAEEKPTKRDWQVAAQIISPCVSRGLCMRQLPQKIKGVVGRSCERMKQEYEAFGVLEEWERVPFLLLLLLLVAFACLHETK